MQFLLRSKWNGIALHTISTYRYKKYSCLQTELKELCNVVSSSVGGLDELESSLKRFSVSLTSGLVTRIIDCCKSEAPSRRLLRFFSWSHKNLNSDLKDEDFNHAIQVFAEKKDHIAMEILISDLRKEGRVMERHTFGLVAEALVKLGREDEALGLFKNLDKFKCPHDSVTVIAIVSALCSKGHGKRAERVVWHYKDKISGVEPLIYKSILHGWSVQENVKEARRVIQEMKAAGIMPDLFCYNTLLRCLCKRNLKRNPSNLVPDALNLMIEMKSHKIAPTSISYNILLSCLGKTRRVKESCNILEMMKKSGCRLDWVSYYLVVRVLYLSGRFGKGNEMVDEMIKEGMVPDRKFYYDLIGILCAVERVNYALELFDHMKRSSSGGYNQVYDVLIPKLCKGGNFEMARELWDEAMGMGLNLQCSSSVLDPSVTEVFKPTKKEKMSIVEETTFKKSQTRIRGTNSKKKKRRKPRERSQKRKKLSAKRMAK